MTHAIEDEINVGDFAYIGIGDIKVGPRRVDEIYVRFNGKKLYTIYSKDVGIALQFARDELTKCSPQENVRLKLEGR